MNSNLIKIRIDMIDLEEDFYEALNRTTFKVGKSKPTKVRIKNQTKSIINKLIDDNFWDLK